MTIDISTAKIGSEEFTNHYEINYRKEYTESYRIRLPYDYIVTNSHTAIATTVEKISKLRCLKNIYTYCCTK